MRAPSKYRPDIDGLRAVAVLTVVFFHLGFRKFSGGYIGVDVFFVVSGFLITRLIVEEFNQTGTFNFSNFYLRRAKRIFPALFVTLGACMLVAVLIFNAEQMERFSGALIHAVMSVSNFYFWFESGYFDTSALVKPLLHTWSLSVEEQFYLLWPACIVFALRRFRIKMVIGLVLLAGFFSFLLNAIFANGIATGLDGVLPPILTEQFRNGRSSIYYLAPFRVFEFAIGASMVWLVQYHPTKKIWLELGVIAGLLMIFVSAIFYTETTLFPFYNALMPCLGAALIIYSGTADYSGKLLNNKLSVGLGLISYSLYLIHWPVIVFFRYWKNADLSGLDQIGIIFFSIAAAYLMYRYVEQPIRTRKTGFFVSPLAFGFACTLLALIIVVPAVNAWANNGWPSRAYILERDIFANFDIDKQKERRFEVFKELCEMEENGGCYSIDSSTSNLLIIGDSMAYDAFNIVTPVLKDYYNIVLDTLTGCPPHDKVDEFLYAAHPYRNECILRNNSRYQKFDYSQVDAVVIDVLMGEYQPQHLVEYTEFLRGKGISKIIIIGNYIILNSDIVNIQLPSASNEGSFSTFSQHAQDNRISNERLAEYSESNDMLYLNIIHEYCASGICETFFDGMPFTWDSWHWSVEFNSVVRERFQSEIVAYLEL